MGPQITQIKARIPLILLIAVMGSPLATRAQCTGVRGDRVAVIAGGFIATTATVIALRQGDWWGTPTRSFHFTSGGSASAGQDRLLHGAIAYHVADLSTHAWHWACAGRAAPWLGAATGFLIGLPKEIGDGLHEARGFAVDDMAFAAIGALLPALHATTPATRIATLKGNWWPSAEFRNRPSGGLPRLETDYAGQRYFLSLVPGRVRPWGPVPWLGIALGHSTASWALTPPVAEWYVTLDVEPGLLPLSGDVWEVIAWLGARIKLPLPGLRISVGTVEVGLY